LKIPRDRLAPTIAVLIAIFVAAMDISIMSTVMPSIVGQLGGLPLYAWSFAAYLLTSTTTVPLYGKLADTYGRKPMFLAGTSLFVVGSLLCGLATSMEQLIAFRAVQGLGAGGILPITITIAGDLFPMEQRAKIQGVISGVWGIAAILGPLAGSLIVSQTTWRWVFWINVPIGFLTMTVLLITFHEQPVSRRHQLDWLGAALLMAGIAALLLALVEGGQSGFTTPLVLGLLGAAAVLLALFTAVELRAPEPVVPFDLLRDRVLGLASLEGFVLGACIYSASSYLPLFVQGAQMGGPREVAWVSAAISVAWTGGSLLGSGVLLRMGFRSAALLGMGVISAGGLLLVGLGLETPLTVVATAGLVLGVGLGVCSTAFIVVVQTAVGWEQRGVATATQQFFRAIGGTLWVSIQGAALSATAAAGLASAGMQVGSGDVVRMSDLNTMLEPSARLALSETQIRLLAQVLEAGLHQVFVLLLAIAVVGLGLAWFLPRGRIPSREETAPAQPARLTNR
jgi:EmrB/QacA subfamily drug resistance transporter